MTSSARVAPHRSAEEPAERHPTHRSVGTFIRSLFHGLAWPAYSDDGPVARKHAPDTRWYSEELPIEIELAELSEGWWL